MHARGLRLRGVLRRLAIAPPPVLPSALLNGVGTPVAIISQLNTLPACAPVNASMAALRLATHDSGSGWIATPFLCDSFIHNSTPVYPGALSSLLKMSHRVVAAQAGELHAGPCRMCRLDGADNLPVAVATGLLGDLPAVRFDLNIVLVAARGEKERMPEAVRCFRRILADEVCWGVATVAGRHGTVR